MKRAFVILAIFLVLLVSCATKAKETTVEPETPDVAASQAVPAEEAPASVETEEAVVEVETEETPVENLEADAAAEEVQAEIPEDASQPLSEEVSELPDESTVEQNDLFASPSVDGTYTFTEEAPAEVSESVEAEAPEAVESEPAEAVEPETAEVSTEVAEAPAAEEAEKEIVEPVAEVSEPVVEEEVAAPISIEDSETLSLIQRIGRGIASQKLLSIGALVCFIGLVYLIVVLVKSAERRPKKVRERYYEEEETPSDEPVENQPEEDAQPMSEDDEFLRELLSEDK